MSGEEDYLCRLRQLCRDYMSEMTRLAADRRFGQGMMGLGGRLGDEPCNKRFTQQVRALFQDMAQDTAVSSGEVRQVLECLYRAPSDYTGPKAAYWMLRAAQTYSLPLVGRLTPADARAVLSAYERAYPRFDRMPAQQEIFTALTEAAVAER